MLERLAEARQRALDERDRAVTQVEATRRDLAHRLRDARRADARGAILTQWKQTMSGPEWDVEDYEWRRGGAVRFLFMTRVRARLTAHVTEV